MLMKANERMALGRRKVPGFKILKAQEIAGHTAPTHVKGVTRVSQAKTPLNPISQPNAALVLAPFPLPGGFARDGEGRARQPGRHPTPNAADR